MTGGDEALETGDAPEADAGTESLDAAFAGTDTCRHLALFSRSRAEQFAAVTAYVKRGLQRNERILYVADDNAPETVREQLSGAGIDVAELTDEGQLVVLDSDEVYAGETFDPVRSAEQFRTFAEDAAADGYAGVRAAGENTWSFGLDCEFETVFDDRVEEMPVTALCQYSLEQFSEAEIGKALQTHEQVVYRGEVCQNPYHVPPSEALERGTPLSNATLLLEQTRDIDAFRRDVETREQRLSVVNRVLRHSLHNDVSVIHGRLEWLTEQEEIPDSGPVREQLDTLAETARRLARLSEKAGHVDRTLDSLDGDSADLNESVAETIEEVTDDCPDATVELERGPAGASVAHDAVCVAVREVLWSPQNGTPTPRSPSDSGRPTVVAGLSRSPPKSRSLQRQRGTLSSAGERRRCNTRAASNCGSRGGSWTRSTPRSSSGPALSTRSVSRRPW